MGFFSKLFGKKKAPAAPKATPPDDSGEDASAKDVVRHIFDELIKGRSRDQICQELVAQGLSKKNADDYIDLVEKTMFKPTIREVATHCRRINEVDTTFPIIINDDGRLMDGGHRLARALLDGRKTIKAVQFKEMPEPDAVEDL
jgi:hypothetical protein